MLNKSKKLVYYTIEYHSDRDNADEWNSIQTQYFGLSKYDSGEHISALLSCFKLTGRYGLLDKAYAKRFLRDLDKARRDNTLVLPFPIKRIDDFRLVEIVIQHKVKVIKR